MSVRYQLMREGRSRWVVYRYAEIEHDVFSHEAIGSVVLDPDGLYYVEKPEWSESKLFWSRPSERGYLLRDTAAKAITHPVDRTVRA